jgi:hypothetical protein
VVLTAAGAVSRLSESCCCSMCCNGATIASNGVGSGCCTASVVWQVWGLWLLSPHHHHHRLGSLVQLANQLVLHHTLVF